MNTRKEQILSLATLWTLLDYNRSYIDSGSGWVEFYHRKKDTDRIVVASLYYKGTYLSDARDASPCLELLQDAYGSENIDFLRIKTKSGNIWRVFDTDALPEPDYALAESDVSRIDCVRQYIENLLSQNKKLTIFDIPVELDPLLPVNGWYLKSGDRCFYSGPFTMPKDFKIPVSNNEID